MAASFSGPQLHMLTQTGLTTHSGAAGDVWLCGDHEAYETQNAYLLTLYGGGLPARVGTQKGGQAHTPLGFPTLQAPSRTLPLGWMQLVPDCHQGLGLH